MSSADVEIRKETEGTKTPGTGNNRKSGMGVNITEEMEKLSKRREQIAAASRKSRERRKIELMNLKKENQLLWEHVDLLNSQLKKYGADTIFHEQLASMKEKRTLDETSRCSSDDEADVVDNHRPDKKKQKTQQVPQQQQQQQVVDINIKPNGLPLLLQSQLINPISLAEQQQKPNHLSMQQHPLMINSHLTNSFSMNPEARIATPPASVASMMLAASNLARTFQENMQGGQNGINTMAFNINQNNVTKSIAQTNPKLAPIITFAETRANWFLSQFKVDLINSFGETLTNEEKILIEKLTAKLSPN